MNIGEYLTGKVLDGNWSIIQKIIKNDDFTTILKQQCGKNRLTIVANIITN